MTKKIFFSSILILSLVSVSWADKGKKNIKSETPQVQKPPLQSPIVTDQSEEKPQAESPASPLQSFEIPWTSINAGGELNLSSTSYKMKVTTGQSAIGESQSTNYKMGVGFWYGVPAGPLCTSKPGDANGSGGVNLVDIVYIVNYVFKSGPKPAPDCRGDANANGMINLVDIIYEVNFVFKGGLAPVKTGVCCL